MDTITIKDIAFTTHIGTSEKERSEAQTLFIDVLIKHKRAVIEDDIATTFDYVPLVKEIYELQHTTRDLIETLAQEVLTLCLADTRVLEVQVTVHKPSALKNGVPSVTLRQQR